MTIPLPTTHGIIIVPSAQEVLDLLNPRSDTYAVWSRDGHPSPAKQGESRTRLSLGVIEAHLEGRLRIGFYMIDLKDTSSSGIYDFDSHVMSLDEARKVYAALSKAGFEALIERSKSGGGYHVWVLFANNFPSFKVRIVLFDILHRSGVKLDGKLKQDKAFDRLFPTQDRVNGGYGNLVAAPFWGSAVEKGNCLFIDPDTTLPFEDQVKVLREVHRPNEADFDQYIEQHQLGKKTALAKARLLGTSPHPYRTEALGDLEDIDHCKFMEHLDRHRHDLPEPQWWAGVDNLSPFGEPGRELFLALSQGHDGFSPEEAHRKFDQALKRREQDISPIGCKKLGELGFHCPVLDTCPAHIPANFPAAYPNTAMSLVEMQEFTQVLAADTETPKTEFGRFSLGWQALSDEDRSAILEQVSAVYGWTTEKQRGEFIKRMKAVRPTLNPPSYLPRVRDFFANIPGHEELVLPSDYVAKNGKLYLMRPSKFGEPELILVSEQMLIITETGHDQHRAEVATRTLAYRTALGEWELIQVARADSSDGRTFHKALSTTSFNMSSDQGGELVRYLRAFEAVNQNLLIPKLTTAQLGWIQTRSGWQFVPYTDAATLVPKGPGEKVIAKPEIWQARGTVEEWLTLFDRVRPYPIATFLLVAAFTAPLLLPFADYGQSHSIVVCLESGRGKSTMQFVGATLYGRGEKALVRSWDSTHVGVEESLALRTFFPSFYEDLHNATDKQMSDMVYLIYNETGRVRGARQGGTRATSTFRTILIGSAEEDIRKMAHFGGFLRRSLVITDNVFGDMHKDDVKKIAMRLLEVARANQGVVGRAWIEFIRARLEQGATEPWQEAIKQAEHQLQSFATINGVSVTDPTHVRLFAHHMVAAQLIEECFDVPILRENLLKVWLMMVRSAVDNSPARMYLHQAMEWVSRMKDTNFIVTDLASMTNQPEAREIFGVYVEQQYVAVFADKLEEYLRRQNNNPRLRLPCLEWAKEGWIETAAEHVNGSTKVRYRIKKASVGGNRPPMIVFLIDQGDGGSNDIARALGQQPWVVLGAEPDQTEDASINTDAPTTDQAQ